MKWDEVRKNYPNQWVKLNVFESHIEGDKKYIDDMEVIKTIESDLEAGRELVKCKGGTAVYHTSHDEIYLRIKNMGVFQINLKLFDMLKRR